MTFMRWRGCLGGMLDHDTGTKLWRGTLLQTHERPQTSGRRGPGKVPSAGTHTTCLLRGSWEKERIFSSSGFWHLMSRSCCRRRWCHTPSWISLCRS